MQIAFTMQADHTDTAFQDTSDLGLPCLLVLQSWDARLVKDKLLNHGKHVLKHMLIQT